MKGLVYLEKQNCADKGTVSFHTRGPHIDDLAALQRLVFDITLTGTSVGAGVDDIIAAKWLYNSTLTAKYTDNELICDAFPLYYMDFINAVKLDNLVALPTRAVDIPIGAAVAYTKKLRLVVDFIPRKARDPKDFEVSLSELGTFSIKFGDTQRVDLGLANIEVVAHADVIYRQYCPVGLRQRFTHTPVSGTGEDEVRLDGRKMLNHILATTKGAAGAAPTVTSEQNLRLYVDDEQILDATEVGTIDQIPATYGEDAYGPDVNAVPAFDKFCSVFQTPQDFSIMDMPHGGRVKSRMGVSTWAAADGHWLQASVLPQGDAACIVKRIPSAEALGEEAAKYFERAVNRRRGETTDAASARWLPRRWHGPVTTPRSCKVGPRQQGVLSSN